MDESWSLKSIPGCNGLPSLLVSGLIVAHSSDAGMQWQKRTIGHDVTFAARKNSSY